jgi:malate dehydrogenase (oxaloacetate-decarboxylating)
MAIAAAYSVAKTAEKRGINPDNIMPKMDEWEVFPALARDVAMQAIKDGVARVKMTAKDAFKQAENDIKESRKLIHHLMEEKFIRKPPISMLRNALKRAIEQVKK